MIQKTNVRLDGNWQIPPPHLREFSIISYLKASLGHEIKKKYIYKKNNFFLKKNNNFMIKRVCKILMFALFGVFKSYQGAL